MRKREVKYRLEVDYYSKDYDDRMCSTSGPIYNLKDGWKQYRQAIKETCIDDKSRPARVWCSASRLAGHLRHLKQIAARH